MSSPTRRGYTLLTGATGFVGHVLLAELLGRGHDCAILSRRPADATLRALSGLLGELGIDAAQLAGTGRLVSIHGDLVGDLPMALPCTVRRIVHAAASTRFAADESGEPGRTNDLGTAKLLLWAERHDIREFHLISTAYSCGRTVGPVPERVPDEPPTSRNAYERSKWMGERHAVRWARSPGRSCTIYRPSIVVGDRETGRASKFSGLYLALRAFDRCMGDSCPASGGTPRRVAMRMEGKGGDRPNFVPVDHVARLIATIIDHSSHHGVVYNLVDPSPRTNQQLLDVLQGYYGVAGCRFVEPTPGVEDGFNGDERLFAAASQALRPYIIGPQAFERTNTARVEAALALPWPSWDDAAMLRLIDVARQANWGRGASQESAATANDPIAEYFERFLPERVDGSGLAGMTSLSTTFRFVIDDVVDGEWVCQFSGGRLTRVRRGVNGGREDFAYRMGSRAFYEIVGARVDPQEVFLDGRAEVSGDVELALKMGMILQQVNREHPYPGRPDNLIKECAIDA